MRLLLLALPLACTVACGASKPELNDASLQSLTSDASVKKYYLGWGIAAQGDPSMMHNEVRYDVKHTHDIFTKGVGGGYKATAMVDRQFSGSQVKEEMDRVKGQLTANDMYVQYSSGHGMPTGLGIGLSYKTIVDNALAMPAKEVVIFMMACHSGGMVDQFNQRKGEWGEWRAKGRSLFVMASSTVQQTSSTGPGTDSGEQGPQGSAGSAYGHALWKTLSGEADGYLDGVKDGFISLGEIAAYATYKTKRVGGHTPQVTGAYDPATIMNKVPSATSQYAAGGSQDLSEGEVRAKVAQLDAAMAAAAPTGGN